MYASKRSQGCPVFTAGFENNIAFKLFLVFFLFYELLVNISNVYIRCLLAFSQHIIIRKSFKCCKCIIERGGFKLPLTMPKKEVNIQ